MLHTCPHCHGLFESCARFCHRDGAELTEFVSGEAVSDCSDSRVGRLLADRYQLRRVIAHGGSGTVYEALDLKNADSELCKYRRAVKISHPDVAADDIAARRFQQEFEVSAQLNNRHIVCVHDWIALENNCCAIVMDYLEGQDLREVISIGRMSVGRWIRIISQLAAALAPVHAAGLVHRDLKPDNVFLCRSRDDGGDEVKLLDFGSVKNKTGTRLRLTAMGMTIGSPYYMSPEQARGDEGIDARADVWAIAIMCYEALSESVPFDAPEPLEVLEAIVQRQPLLFSEAVKRSDGQRGGVFPPSEHVALSVDRVMERAMEKNPLRRIGSVSAFVDSFGKAWGLEGDHMRWAYASETQLQNEIDRYGENLSADGSAHDEFRNERELSSRDWEWNGPNAEREIDEGDKVIPGSYGIRKALIRTFIILIVVGVIGIGAAAAMGLHF